MDEIQEYALQYPNGFILTIKDANEAIRLAREAHHKDCQLLQRTVQVGSWNVVRKGVQVLCTTSAS